LGEWEGGKEEMSRRVQCASGLRVLVTNLDELLHDIEARINLHRIHQGLSKPPLQKAFALGRK
jgi:hypothetical protein